MERMAKNKNKNSEKRSKKDPWHHSLKPETKKSLLAIISFAGSFILTLAAFGKAGPLGNVLQKFLVFLFGKGFFLAPLAFFLEGIAFLLAPGKRLIATNLIGGALFLVSSLGALDILFGPYTGGYTGYLASFQFLKWLDFWASIVIFSALFVSSVIIMLNIPLRPNKDKEEVEEEFEEKEKMFPALSMMEEIKAAVLPKTRESKKEVEKVEADKESESEDEETLPKANIFSKASPQKKHAMIKYTPPPLDLLESDKGTISSGDIKANSNIIKRTLENFGIDVEMAEINVGPSVTQYTLKPAEGIKLSRITALHSDLSLALAAHPIRIEAPIPGKSLVGIEIPNRSISLVGLRTLFSMEDFQNSYPLTIVLGRDVSGKPVFADIAKMPHLLIAGATGSGKSIAIHTLITSVLYKNSPEFLRLIMIDPKRVELSMYNEIPHLLTPVITDAKKAIQALRWGTKEMEKRYELLSGAGARDINSYNSQMLKGDSQETMPNILVIIDELADLMMSFPREVEASIVRLAQMSRAVGIHLIVSTQRPSVEVITGLIKANITSRVALQVASGIDSRTILDMSGAEKLLGNGDMLFLAGDTSKPRRIQGAYISEKEVKKVVTFLAKSATDFEKEEINLDVKLPQVSTSPSDFIGDDEGRDDDELFEQARELVIEAGKASASYLQRRLRVGYARAARLLDMLEEQGVIGPGEGAKPREVMIKKEGAPGAEASDEENLSELNNF